MDWRFQLNAAPLPWLLEEGEPGVRYLALRDLLVLKASGAWRILATREKWLLKPGRGYNTMYSR